MTVTPLKRELESIPGTLLPELDELAWATPAEAAKIAKATPMNLIA
jgi:hypothetical protein